ncbi:hypothetical protein JCM19297_2680 [Nonlabens ulvanivorans]|nr:hypothetical protein JCM19297_2680 [Nonlabens ulvanivorans]
MYFDVDKDQFSFSEGKQLTSFFDDLIYKPILTVKILGIVMIEVVTITI